VRLLWRRHRVEQADLQGNVLCAYGNRYRHALYAFVNVLDSAAGRDWLDALLPEVTNAVPWNGRPPRSTLNVAISCNGLRALGVPEPMIATFPPEFREGMAARAEDLGDIGKSAPSEWDRRMARPQPEGGPPQEHDILMTLSAVNPQALQDAWERRLPGAGLVRAHVEVAELLGNPAQGAAGREHFGFADGFGQPTIKGNAGPWERPGGGTLTKRGCWKPLAPGEFVLGYPGEDGTLEPAPAPPFDRSGTFTVVRKLYQDVAAFTNFLRREGGGNQAREEWIAARMVGRWRDGTPLMLSPHSSNGPLASDYGPGGRVNDFSYENDQEGLRCPLGAHVRRANPRDSFGWQARLTKRHRIIRRGMPYGKPPPNPAKSDSGDRGLIFVCHQASIERQFEVIQGKWLNDGDAFWLGEQGDLLTSDGRGEGMTIQGRPPFFTRRPPPLVINRGGGYFFTPGISSLQALAAGAWL
jgi:Dyp-type peroxidase family